MITIRRTFQKVKARAIRKGTCPICGARWVRRKTFTHTVNPFNRNDLGRPKTPQEVKQDVEEEATRWDPGPHCPAVGAG